jgi:hypothetical protein
MQAVSSSAVPLQENNYALIAILSGWLETLYLLRFLIIGASGVVVIPNLEVNWTFGRRVQLINHLPKKK